MTEIVWSPDALADVLRIAGEMRQVDPDFTAFALDRIEAAPEMLLRFPALGPVATPDGLRKRIVRSTPFILLYAVEGEAIVVARVFHEREDWRVEP